MKRITLMLFALLISVPAFALDYNQFVTPDVIFGSGNDNGHFTVFTASDPSGNTIELGLRAKVRFNSSGQPENTFNEELPGEYYFLAGVGTGQSGITPTWAFEWTVNTDVTSTGIVDVGDLVYELGLDYDPGPGTNFVTFDPIDPSANTVHGFWDHAMGDNSTANGAGLVAGDVATYQTYLQDYNVAQNSWRYSWFDAYSTFNPNVTGIYDIYLSMSNHLGQEYGRTEIKVHVVPYDPVATEAESWGAIKSMYR